MSSASPPAFGSNPNQRGSLTQQSTGGHANGSADHVRPSARSSLGSRSVASVPEHENTKSSKSKQAASTSGPRSLLTSTHFDPTRESRSPSAFSVPQSTKLVNRASASPSLSSLLNDPPSPPAAQLQQKVPTPPTTSNASKPSPPQSKAISEITKSSNKRSAAGASNVTSGASSPKPKGNGLLAGVLGENVINDEPEPQIPTVVLNIPIAAGETNKYVNFARLAEERYGFDAMNPQLARARAGLFGRDASGDELLMDDSESDSNMEEKPGEASGVEREPKPKKEPKKKRKIEELYDGTDPFIDDSEMLWEEQAATSKEGFFVYAGPLVPEGEKAQVERADGTVKRGRGGRGRGSASTRAGGATGKPAVPRKPRVTKAIKERMDREKEEREKAGMKLAAGLTA